MEKIFNQLIKSVHFLAAIALILVSLVIMGWSIFEIVSHFLAQVKEGSIPLLLQSVGAIIIAAAIIDVAQYIIEEEVFQKKELRNPDEARKTVTKIMVIISIAVSIEGLVYIFKAGTTDLELLLYPAVLIFVSSSSIVALGVYQKLSIVVENETDKNHQNSK